MAFLAHLNVSLPPGDRRTAAEVEALIVGVVEVGLPADERAEVVVALVEEV